MTVPQAAQIALQQGNYAEAIPLLRDQLRPPRPFAKKVCHTLLRALLATDAQQEAQDLLTKLQKEYPDDPETTALQALIHDARGETQEAKVAYHKALARLPSRSDLHYNLGRLLTHQPQLSSEDATQAEKHLQQALSLDSNHFQAQFELAALYTRLDRPQEAIAACQRTLERNPTHLRAILFLGELFTMVGEFDAVAQLYHSGLLHNPQAHRLRDALLQLYQLEGAWEEALEVSLEQCRKRGSYEDFLTLGTLALQLHQPRIADLGFLKACDVNPQDTRASYNLAELYRSSAHYGPAQEAYTRVLEHSPSPQAHNGLGLVALEQEQLTDALSHFQSAQTMEPTNPIYIHNLALCLQRTGQEEPLTALLEEAKSSIAPDDPYLPQILAIGNP